MTKTDFCKRLNERGYDRNLSEKIYEDVLDIVVGGLVADGGVNFFNFGRFQVKEKNYGATYTGKVAGGLYGNKFIAFTPATVLTKLVNGLVDNLDDE